MTDLDQLTVLAGFTIRPINDHCVQLVCAACPAWLHLWNVRPALLDVIGVAADHAADAGAHGG